MREDKIKKYCKKHADVFQQARNEQEEFHSEPIMDRDIPPMDWLAEGNPEFRSTKAQGRKGKRPWYVSRGLWIPVTACAMLALIFSVTPWGQATASSAYTAVVKLFSGGSNVQHGKGDHDMITPTQNQDAASYSSIDEVRKALGKKIALHTSGYDIESIEVAHDGYNTIIETIYKNTQYTINLKQTILDSMTEWSNTQSYAFDQTFHEKMLDGTEVVGYVNAHNAYAVAYKSDMMLEFQCKDIPYNDFYEFIRNVKFQ